jgi:hypothetical protein
MPQEIRARRPLAWQFGMREWMFYVMHIAVGMGAVMWPYPFGPAVLLGSLLATITISAFFVPAKPALVDLGIIAVLCTLSIIAVALEDGPGDVRAGPAVWVLWRSELVCLGVLPVVAGVFRKRLSTFVIYTVAFLLAVGIFALFRDDDAPTFAMVLWTASSICFAGTTACRHCVRQRRWVLLPLAVLCLLFGELRVFAVSWGLFFLE